MLDETEKLFGVVQSKWSAEQKTYALQKWTKFGMQVIHPVCGRHTAILDDKMVALDLTDSGLPDEPEIIIIDRHKKFPGAGKKATTKFKVQ